MLHMHHAAFSGSYAASGHGYRHVVEMAGLSFCLPCVARIPVGSGDGRYRG